MRIVQVMILRFLDIGFLCFLDFLVEFGVVGSLAAFSSPLFSSKSKTWVGLRKSSVMVAEDLGGIGLVAGVSSFFSWTGILTGLIGFAGEGFDITLVDLGMGFLVVAFLGVLEEEVAFLERRVTSPSIDLFLSIVYNYSIMAVKLTKKQLAVLNFL